MRNNNKVLALAAEIGDELVKEHGRMALDGHGCGGVVEGTVRAVTEDLVMVVAEIMQSWLDAGSEREVTFENEALADGLMDEVNGWVIPSSDTNYKLVGKE